MKIILSHDVDHLHWNEHYFSDLTLQKHVYRHSMALLKKGIPFSLWKSRMKVWGRKNRLPELLEFYEQKKITANFFFGMDNALGLVYKPSEAKPWIKKVLEKGHDVGVHGIAYANPAKIKKEYKTFQEISGLNEIGIRNHYLRMNGYTLEMLSQQDYQFDSTIQGILHPFKIGNMWEIPMSLMDVSLVPNSQSNMNLKTWKEATLLRFDKAQELNIPYFVVNLHDLYFDPKQFPNMYEWFIWFLEEIQAQDIEIITFKEAVRELEEQ